MKILIVNHDVSNYGAATSLSLMLKKNTKHEYDMIVPVKWEVNRDEIKKRFNVYNLFFLYIQIDMDCFIGGKDKNKSLLKKLFDFIKYKFAYSKYKFIVFHGNYNFIYINSLTLYRYILNNKKTIIHIRESLKKERKDLLSKINNAAGAVFIDKSTYMPFSNSIEIPFKTINNPFDMTHICKYVYQKDFFLNVNIGNKTVFSIIGQVTREKGVLDIVDSFHKINNNNIILFIAGNCSECMHREISTLCNNDERIVILGHMDDVSMLYNITDYLIRGERYQCIGRTIFEALFSGCYVLIPGENTYEEDYKDLYHFNDKIIYYPPGNFARLKEVILGCIGKKVIKRNYISNVDRHVEQLNSFFEEIVF